MYTKSIRQVQKRILLDLVCRDLLKLCSSPYGCEIALNILERGPEKYEAAIYEAVSSSLFEMIEQAWYKPWHIKLYFLIGM